MMEFAWYSVISPEACSAILWKDRKHAPEAAEALKLTSHDLMRLGVVDEVVSEPDGGAHRDHDLAAANLGAALRRNLKRALETPIEELLKERYAKFRKLGNFAEPKTKNGSRAPCTAGRSPCRTRQRRAVHGCAWPWVPRCSTTSVSSPLQR